MWSIEKGRACASILIIFDCITLEARIALAGGVVAQAIEVCVREMGRVGFEVVIAVEPSMEICFVSVSSHRSC